MKILTADPNFFQKIWIFINEKLMQLDFDGKIVGLYEKFIATLPELFKWLLLVLTIIILILGIISFVKKTFKVSIILGIIIGVIFLIFKK